MFLHKTFTYLNSLPAFTKAFCIGFVIFFVLDGIGVIPKGAIFSWLILFTTILSFYFLKNNRVIIFQNRWMTSLLLGYLVLLFYLSFFSFNTQVSFELIVFITLLFVLYFIVFTEFAYLQKIFLYVILGLGVFFCVYSFILIIFGQLQIPFLIPKNGYQYVYAVYGANHLGEFLVFPLLISISCFLYQRKSIFLFLFSFFFIFFLFSYSRTAYVAFFIGLFLISITSYPQIPKKIFTIIMSIFIGIVLFFLLTTFYPTWRNYTPFISNPSLEAKSVPDTREIYLVQGIKGFLMNRFYGVGLGNFEYASRMFTNRQDVWATSSHNLYLDMLTETGTISFIIFLIITIFFLRTIRSYNRNIYAVMLFSWFIMVQFDYLHKIYSYLLLFPLFLVGLFHTENYYLKKNLHLLTLSVTKSRLFLTIPLFLLIFFFILYVGSGITLYFGHKYFSRMIYPLQKSAYDIRALDTPEVLETYIRLFPGEYIGAYKKGVYFQNRGEMNQAIKYYEKSFWLDLHRDLLFAEKLYNLKRVYQGDRLARQFIEKVFIRLHNTTGVRALSYKERIFFNKLCQKFYSLHCIYTLE